MEKITVVMQANGTFRLYGEMPTEEESLFAYEVTLPEGTMDRLRNEGVMSVAVIEQILLASFDAGVHYSVWEKEDAPTKGSVDSRFRVTNSWDDPPFFRSVRGTQ